jgi:diadenosine tetraphosphate (Ap4A) HIT family hydrolase
MAKIYQTKNFIVESAETPHITRTDGGHIRIFPKEKVVNRTELTPKLATELMRLTMIVGKAMSAAMNRRGVDIGRINYQDNGNWSVFSPEGPFLHVHLYGRAKSAKIQKYGEACHFPNRDTGFYDNFEPLNREDILEIKKEIEKIFTEDKYSDKSWGL